MSQDNKAVEDGAARALLKIKEVEDQAAAMVREAKETEGPRLVQAAMKNPERSGTISSSGPGGKPKP